MLSRLKKSRQSSSAGHSGGDGTKRLVIGLLAHVDAGKTTLSESLLYTGGVLRKMGRVDNRDAFLDTEPLERERGITIFSKQALMPLPDWTITWMDTPGHVDFSAEMERTLQVLDYAVLVINGADGVQGHTCTLWRLLRRYRIPVFLFINKMDQPGTDRGRLLKDVKEKLDERCVAFGPEAEADSEHFGEEIALCGERWMEIFLDQGGFTEKEIAEGIAAGEIFPCYFGSALKLTGVEAFLQGLLRFAREAEYPAEFGAKVYKIMRDDGGARLTCLKVTGGVLRVKDEIGEGKIDQIRVYSGAKFEAVSEAEAGMICAVAGLDGTKPGDGLGYEPASEAPVLEPILTYRVFLPPEQDALRMLPAFRRLEEEEPELHVVWDERLKEIRVQLMGEVQIEVLRERIRERFGVEVTFGSGSIVYKETVAAPVEGVGHFEPLRHYAEVHLLLEPGERGSGLQFSSVCSEDVLDRNWQRLILTHLEEREHPGVLTGSAITDMKITLLTGRAHLKHTEGGYFRQATYRAVRQGLKEGESVLLEPWYEFRMELPAEAVGRAMSDIQKMGGVIRAPEMRDGISVLAGEAPVSGMRDYPVQVVSYTRGQGRILLTFKGYERCPDPEAVREAIGYDSERDAENPTGSVFCAHGAGFAVPWNRVKEYMHLPGRQPGREGERSDEGSGRAGGFLGVPESGDSDGIDGRTADYFVDEEEIREIFSRAFGQNKKEKGGWNRKKPAGKTVRDYPAARPTETRRAPRPKAEREYLLVDGYNIIYAWEELRKLAERNLDAARGKLMDILCNYQGYRKCRLILVFDAYKVEGHACEIVPYHNIHVVYTREAETADQYIEKVAHEIGRKYSVTVATSDGLEQVIIRGQGCRLFSALEFWKEIKGAEEEIRKEHLREQEKGTFYLFQGLDGETAGYMEDIRLGKTEPGNGEKSRTSGASSPG
ncbi:MAG: GTP-binding protein [Lachnospiraceae bacterium]|nr:GTP-binding protein [Lachnospiraceae bacterium]